MACVHAFSQKRLLQVVSFARKPQSSVTCGANLIAMRDGLDMLLPKLACVIHQLKHFAIEYKDLPYLAYTHGEAAMPTIVKSDIRLKIQVCQQKLKIGSVHATSNVYA